MVRYCTRCDMKTKKRPNIVSVHLSPESKQRLDQVCATRGMSIKMLLGRLITWFVELDKTEQSIVLGQVEVDDVRSLAELVLRRRNTDNGTPRRTAARRRRKK